MAADMVRAKRLGWDEELTPEQALDMDPYDASDDDLEGELVKYDVPEAPEHPAFHVCLVGGQEADPTTVEPVE